MNVIALTGANPHAMADVAELLLQAISGRAHQVAVMVYVDCAQQVRALRDNAQGVIEVWRVGADPSRGYLDQFVDAFISDGAALSEDVMGQLARFFHVVTSRAVPAAPTFN